MSSLEKRLYEDVVVKSKTNLDKKASKSPTYKGFSTINEEASSSTLYDIALIKQDIINHFHIRQGEKLSDPEFGTIIWDVLFEPLTDQIRDAITNNVTKIINYDPRVNVNQVIVDTYESGIQIEVSLVYKPYNISETMRMQFDENAGFLS